MANDAVADAYNKLGEDAMNDAVPRPTALCQTCSEIGVPFSLDGASGARDADQILGIPPVAGAATLAWFTNNRWIRDKVQNFRDTFLLRVATRLGELHDEAYLAEFYAFIASQEREFVCIDIEMDTETYVTPRFLAEVTGNVPTPPTVSCDKGNFAFHGNRIYFWTFTAARFVKEMPAAEPGGGPLLGAFDWRISGFYDIDKAARELASHYERAKAIAKEWTKFWGVVNVIGGVLSFVPLVGPAGRGLFGAYRGVRYVVTVIDGALALNAMGSGCMQAITGEDIDVGEKIFARLGELADPKDGAERGKQVFMFINLAMLAPLAFGGAKWVLRKFRNGEAVTAHLDVKALQEEERKRLAGHTSAEVRAIELQGSKKGTSATQDDMGQTVWSDRPSLDTNSSQISLVPATGRANYGVMAPTMRERLVALIVQHGGSLKVVGRIAKVVGDAGEEALAATMIEKWGFDAKRILGYSSDPKIPSRFGLSNQSNQGLDMLVWVPPPPEITVRVPATDTLRHSIDGVKGPAQKTVTKKFTEDTLLVIETKATLGQAETPRFNKTQPTGSGKVATLLKKITANRGHWKHASMTEVDPGAMRKVKAIEDATQDGNIQYLHAQVFFDNQGQLNSLVGGGSGVQLNIW